MGRYYKPKKRMSTQPLTAEQASMQFDVILQKLKSGEIPHRRGMLISIPQDVVEKVFPNDGATAIQLVNMLNGALTRHYQQVEKGAILIAA